MIDVKTAFILWVAQAGALAVLLLGIWLQARKEKHFLYFGIGFALHASGLALVALRGQIPDALSIHLGNPVSLLAFAAWTAAVGAIDKKRVPFFAFTPPLVWIAANLIPAIRDDFAFRVATYNFAAGLGFAALSFAALTVRFSTVRYRALLASIWLAQSVCAFLFAAAAGFFGADDFSNPPATIWAGLAAVVGFIASLVILAKMLMDRSEERLKLLARTDSLTGVLNRRGFSAAFDALTSTTTSPLIAVVLFDLDHFKHLNDRHGHAAGDAALVEFAYLCGALLPETAAFGRTGGEEFAAVLTIGEPRDAALFAETVRLAIAGRKIRIGDQDIQITTSVGIAVGPKEVSGLDGLLSRADEALYAAKKQGRNRTSLKAGDRIVTVPPTKTRTLDAEADKQVAILRRIAAAGAALDD
ncbi:GGDEF domain-containing protein [Rhizobium sp. G187]|uniref:GGDEF domain-containing protein n=1 Tax=Rhizobium sp. G187 TaxID=3451352 RepID=UPI003EE4544B